MIVEIMGSKAVGYKDNTLLAACDAALNNLDIGKIKVIDGIKNVWGEMMPTEQCRLALYAAARARKWEVKTRIVGEQISIIRVK